MIVCRNVEADLCIVDCCIYLSFDVLARPLQLDVEWTTKKERIAEKKKPPFRFGLKAKECEKSSGSKKKESKKSAGSKKKESVVVESATKAPKAKKVCLTTDKKAPKPKVAKVTPPKLDVPTGVGVQLKRPPECLDDSSGKKARTEIAEQRIIECRRGCIRREEVAVVRGFWITRSCKIHITD